MNITQIDFDILNFIRNNISNPVLDPIAKAVTFLGELGWFWIVLTVLLLFTKKFRKAGIAMGLALLMCVIIGNGILKPMIARIRPYDINTAIQLIIDKPTDFSFPSGHTLSSFAAATGLFIYHKKTGICAIILAAMIGLSRLYLYVHYPSDVLVGCVLGIIFAVLSAKIVNSLFVKYHLEQKLRITNAVSEPKE